MVTVSPTSAHSNQARKATCIPSPSPMNPEQQRLAASHRPSSQSRKLGALAVAGPFLALPFGPLANMAALALIVLAVLVAVARGGTKLDSPIVWTCVAISVWWLVLFLNPNVINLTAGVTGYRASVTFAFGILLGYLWASESRFMLALVWWCLVISCSASIVVFLYIPEIESSIFRAADFYTSNFHGSRRLQGLFSGPFHASLAGVFLALSSIRARSVVPSLAARSAGLTIGLLTIFFAQVRSGYVALIVGTVVISILGVRKCRRILVLYGLAVSSVCAFAFSGPIKDSMSKVPALESLLFASEDSRLVGREETWRRAIEMTLESPIIGWGPGSAGATLGALFPPGGHVTSHNMILKYSVEGGLIGGLLILVLFVAICVVLIRTGDRTGLALPALVPLIVFGTIGSTVDALPVSFGLAVILGICANPHNSDGRYNPNYRVLTVHSSGEDGANETKP